MKILVIVGNTEFYKIIIDPVHLFKTCYFY